MHVCLFGSMCPLVYVSTEAGGVTSLGTTAGDALRVGGAWN